MFSRHVDLTELLRPLRAEPINDNGFYLEVICKAKHRELILVLWEHTNEMHKFCNFSKVGGKKDALYYLWAIWALILETFRVYIRIKTGRSNFEWQPSYLGAGTFYLVLASVKCLASTLVFWLSLHTRLERPVSIRQVDKRVTKLPKTPSLSLKYKHACLTSWLVWAEVISYPGNIWSKMCFQSLCNELQLPILDKDSNSFPDLRLKK